MIYIVEDDENIRELMTYTINNSGLEAKGFSLPSQFFKAMANVKPELVLLDIMLPEQDGLSILKKIRSDSETKKLPVILVTAKDSEYDKVIGLDNGADDYISKPFGMMELVARIRALLRRTRADESDESYLVGPLFVSPAKHVVKVDGQNITLTYKEFEILCLLLKNQDIVLTRDRLLNEIWGYSFDGENRTVDVHIRTLRQKLGAAGDVIETVRGIGYKVGGKGNEE